MDLCLRPDWRSPVSESLTFKTTIFRSRSGKEQRRALRTHPRKKVSLSVLSVGDKHRALDKALFVRGKAALTMGDFSAGHTVLKVDVAASTSVLYIETFPHWLVVGVTLQVHFDDRCENATVLSIAPTGAFSDGFDAGFGPNVTAVTLTAPLVSHWPTGAKIYPTENGRLGVSQTLNLVTDNTSSETVVFAVLSGAEVPVVSPVEIVFDGREAALVKPNWRTRVALTHTTPTEVVDYGRGIDVPFLPEDYVTSTYKYGFTGTRAKVLGLRDTFLRMKGRRGEFYMPTWVSDMVPFSGVGENSSQLPVSGTDWAATFTGSTVRAAVMVETSDGTIYLRGVSAIQNSADVVPVEGVPFDAGFDSGFESYNQSTPHTILTLSEPIVSGIHKNDIVKISWLHRVRFATDTLVTTWETNGTATTQVTVTTLEQLGGV